MTFLKSIVLVTIFSFIYAISLFGQKKTETELDEYDVWNSGMTFTIQAGVWKPLGNLKNTFDLNPNISFRFGFPVYENIRIDLGTSINIPFDSKEFNYYTDYHTYTATSKNTVNGMLGLWFGKENRLSKKVFLDNYFGVGVGFIQTGIPNPEPEHDNDNWYAVETVNFNFGLSLRKIVMAKRSIGLFCEYNYAPYGLSERVDNDFGNSFLIYGFVYRY